MTSWLSPRAATIARYSGRSSTASQNRRAALQVVDRLEQRHDADRAVRVWLARSIQQPGLLQQDRGLEHVRHRLAHRDDVVGHRRGPKTWTARAAAATMSSSLRARSDSSASVADQRPPGGQFGRQQLDPLRLGQRRVVGVHPGPRQQLGDDLLVHIGVLPHVQAGQMKTEDAHGFPQPRQPVVGQHRAAVGAQRRVDDVEVGQQLRRACSTAGRPEVELVLAVARSRICCAVAVSRAWTTRSARR